MSTSFEAQDTLVRGAQLKVQSLMIKADLEAGTSDEPSVMSVTGGGTAAVSIDVDLAGETVKKVQKAEVYDNQTGAVIAQSAAPTFTGSVITIADVDASVLDLSDCCVSVHYEVE